MIQVLVMGVCGVGKSTIGRQLANSLDAQFLDADDFHSKENQAHMSMGLALNDETRKPWLMAVVAALNRFVVSGERVVLACSALKQEYREILLASCPNSQVVFLHADESLIRSRLRQRTGHFAAESLLKTQLETLEEPEDAIWIKITPLMTVARSTNLTLSLLRIDK
ncbi:gluconokinase, GntK/IdnK-type [Gammaproteobacteria bacterium]|jgi:gluconokinase|nr:AAA family ATPase [Opitutae bacterium]MBT6529283.1 AAA family ATPase [Betaproteobacteria bacterium]MDB4826734.1 gluconokinase, GntK/IdnK-type [Gammaproteobacteria bacterium]